LIPITVFVDPDQQFCRSRSVIFSDPDHCVGVEKIADRDGKIREVAMLDRPQGKLVL
jgi:hypothetical protein